METTTLPMATDIHLIYSLFGHSSFWKPKVFTAQLWLSLVILTTVVCKNLEPPLIPLYFVVSTHNRQLGKETIYIVKTYF